MQNMAFHYDYKGVSQYQTNKKENKFTHYMIRVCGQKNKSDHVYHSVVYLCIWRGKNTTNIQKDEILWEIWGGWGRENSSPQAAQPLSFQSRSIETWDPTKGPFAVSAGSE